MYIVRSCAHSCAAFRVRTLASGGPPARRHRGDQYCDRHERPDPDVGCWVPSLRGLRPHRSDGPAATPRQLLPVRPPPGRGAGGPAPRGVWRWLRSSRVLPVVTGSAAVGSQARFAAHTGSGLEAGLAAAATAAAAAAGAGAAADMARDRESDASVGWVPVRSLDQLYVQASKRTLCGRQWLLGSCACVRACVRVCASAHCEFASLCVRKIDSSCAHRAN